MATIHEQCVQTLRFLAADEVEKAKSGHPGFPLGTAPLMYTVWDKFMKYNPADPKWFNRDRFILSPGHGSALLYAMLHLAGYDLTIDDLKNFRQWGSKTPGHPEYGVTAGVDVSTGPLGHGLSMGVGFALAESMLAAKYNKPDFPVIDHYTYGLVSDGDLMEGVASEAASLAGTLGLGKLIYLYDDNKITIEGSTDIAFTECVETRFKAYGWQVLRVESSEDLDALEAAVKEAQTDKDEVLHKVCRPVEKFDDRLATLLDDMHETLDKAQGLGLAAPQVGILRRVFVIDIGEGRLDRLTNVLSALFHDGLSLGELSCREP